MLTDTPTLSPESNTHNRPILPTGEATGILPAGPHHSPITVIANDAIRSTLCEATRQQAINSRTAPGITDVVLNPDAHVGYGAPIGCVMVSPSHIYPGPVGVDIKCSMSLLQFNIPSDDLNDRALRRALINAILQRIPTGPGKGQRSARKSRHVDLSTGIRAITEGATPDVCAALGIPPEWTTRCEDSGHTGHDDTHDALRKRLEHLILTKVLHNLPDRISQLGSYGGGNHFGECEAVSLTPRTDNIAEVFGLRHGCAAFLSHCGSRGIGHTLAANQFRTLQKKFADWSIPLPAGDKHLVYAPLGTPEANNYIDDMSLGANFATVNHLLINALVLEAFQEVLPGTRGEFVYFISHNFARKEVVNNKLAWVHRKGATRAMPAGHHELSQTPFATTGHPILLPGNPVGGSVVMVASEGASQSHYSVNHGAGRAMGRKNACRTLNQTAVDAELTAHDILHNGRQYPLDEAPAAYKNFAEVVSSVETAGLATTVAHLKARFVIKDSDKADD